MTRMEPEYGKSRGYIKLAAEDAEKTMAAGIDGPFDAVVVKNGEIISVASNTVLGDHDPTAHAEVNVIRKACRKLGIHDFSGCEIYATGSPCPMCMFAIIWANIKKAYISGLPEDGCRDEKVVQCERLKRETAQKLYKKYHDTASEIY